MKERGFIMIIGKVIIEKAFNKAYISGPHVTF